MERDEDIQRRIEALNKELFPELSPGEAEALNKDLDNRIDKLRRDLGNQD